MVIIKKAEKKTKNQNDDTNDLACEWSNIILNFNSRESNEAETWYFYRLMLKHSYSYGSYDCISSHKKCHGSCFLQF